VLISSQPPLGLKANTSKGVKHPNHVSVPSASTSEASVSDDLRDSITVAVPASYLRPRPPCSLPRDQHVIHENVQHCLDSPDPMVLATVAQSIASTNVKMETYSRPSVVTELVKATSDRVRANLNNTDLLLLRLYALLSTNQVCLTHELFRRSQPLKIYLYV
jgi:hypothetical protein